MREGLDSQIFERPQLRKNEAPVDTEKVVDKKDDVVHGVNLADYGNELNHDFIVEPGVSVEATEVEVSHEHLSELGDQRRPVSYVIYDRKLAGSMPAGEVSWKYAEMPDGTVEIEDMGTVARADGKEQRQSMHRTFRGDGTVSQEDVLVDGKLFKSRVYGEEEYDGEIVYDDFYRNDGSVERKVVFYKTDGEGAWKSYSTIYKDGDDKLERVEGSLSGPPVLRGIPQLNTLVDPPTLAYRSPNKRPRREVD
ncbi:hypothetical protein HQ524_04290 [Candidatus Uhrbacteria bacterium]|nr:hypothetical protein [Candidatus Uhrbacteria bacterium]